MHTSAKETMRSTPDRRPTAAAVREAIFAKIDRAGAAGISNAYLLDARPAGLGSRNLTAPERDAAIVTLAGEGRITITPEPDFRGRTMPVYRSKVAVEREAWFHAEVRRRGYVKAHSLPMLGKIPGRVG